MTAPRPLDSLPDRAWITWPVLVALLVVMLGSLSEGILSDPDTLWHIAAGRWMVEHRALPMRDMFSWTMPGAPWTAHEWLSELLLYGVWSFMGLQGAVILATACFALTAAYLVRFLCDRVEPQQVVPIALLFLGQISIHFLARPHVMVWPLVAVWVGTLVATVDARRSPPWWLLLLLLLWANLHASFTLGVGVAAALALDAIVEAPSADARRQALTRWSTFGVGCVIAVAINPNGLGTLTHALHMMQMKETLAVISEWKSADFHQFHFILLWMLVVFGLALLGRLRLSPVRVLLLLGLLYIALKHVRYHSTLGLTSVFLLAGPMASALRFRRSDETAAQAQTLDAIMRRLCAPTHRAAVAAAVVAAGLWFTAIRPWIPATSDEQISPERAIRAYEATGLGPGRLFNGYAFGGYLIYRGIPVFVDGRADMYGDAFIKELWDKMTMKDPHGLEHYLDRYRITWTLLAPATPAVELLDHLPAWRRLYADSVAVVHVRQTDTTSTVPAR